MTMPYPVPTATTVPKIAASLTAEVGVTNVAAKGAMNKTGEPAKPEPEAGDEAGCGEQISAHRQS